MPTKYSNARKSQQPRSKPLQSSSKDNKRQTQCKMKVRHSTHHDQGFISCINSYIQQLDTTKSGDKYSNPISNIHLKIEHEQKINQNLQKCLIQMHQVLWERQQTIQKLHTQIKHQSHRSIQNSEDSSSSYDQNYPDIYIKPRRKTQISAQIEKILGNTIGIKSKNTKRIF